MFIEFCFLVIIDIIFVLAVFLLMMPLLRRQAAFAVMKRNFSGYFSNPTGYVFLCIFVLLTSFAAFWPHEFFTTNLANFDQLNRFLPYIMLVFIPAITMSIWAEERRQGTDELLLTLPARDFDIVIGKYFAAIWVFTVSLLFSQLSNYAVLLAMTGGHLDTQLLFSMYMGYWFMGISMLSIGMVASFLTNNLTVGFIFGAAFNAPLAFFSNADVILSSGKWVSRLFDWSLLQRFEPFGRGLVALPSIFYFLGIVVIGIYLSLILIGRRHWLGGRDGTSMFWHYILRAAFLVVTVIAGVVIVQYSPASRARMDISAEKVSTLSESTKKLLDELAAEADQEKPPIKIEAFISNNIPTEFVAAKYDLVNLLREFDVRAGKQLQVSLHQGIEPFSQEAIIAEQRYGIRARSVTSQSRGALRQDQVVMGVAITSGLEQVVIDFFPSGTPVEYELMRSIDTVSKSGRKKIGVVETDAFPMGTRLTAQDGTSVPIPRLEIIRELEKQYDVEPVSAASPISVWITDENGVPLTRRYDTLLVIQPSTMTPGEMENLIGAIQSGQPTAIFEDPFPLWQMSAVQGARPRSDGFKSNVSGTFYPRMLDRQGGAAADMQKLWDALDINVERNTATNPPHSLIAWQPESENPYPRDPTLNIEELIIVRQETDAFPGKFAEHAATIGITELNLQYAGFFAPLPGATLAIEPLVTSDKLGVINTLDLQETRGDRRLLDTKRGAADETMWFAAHIFGSRFVDPLSTEAASIELPESENSETRNKRNTNVIYVADIDLLSDYFVRLRNNPIQEGVEYRNQNMSFVLNAIDYLSGVDSFFELRNRKFRHVTLRVVEEVIEAATAEVFAERQKFLTEDKIEREKLEERIQQDIGKLSESYLAMTKKIERNEPVDQLEYQRLETILKQKIAKQQQEVAEKSQLLDNERRNKLRDIQLRAESKIQETQRFFKLMAVLIPPIPPLLVGLIVYTRRRLREREGISKARRLK